MSFSTYLTIPCMIIAGGASILFSQTFSDMSHLLNPAAPVGEASGQRGASAADFNNDGRVDIYHANFREPGRLYLNGGENGFHDILPEIELQEGANMWGAAFGDYDNDGYLDIIFEDLSAPSKLYRNNRNTSFTEVNDIANVTVHSLAQGAAWGDFNLDGLLDFIIVNDIGPNQLFKNLDRRTFSDISKAANVETFGNSYGVSWGDINNDGYPDAYIATCHGSDPLRSINHLLLNNGDETFTDIGPAAGVADSLAGWGPVIFDYDNDNDLDIFVTNSYHQPRNGYNRLYRNDGESIFANVSFPAGVAGEADEDSYGVAVADFDNDGWEDIYITNLPRRDRLYRNNGDGTFSDIAGEAGITDNEHRAVAVADFNNDGWIDIFTVGQPQNRLLYNNGGDHHWIRISLRGISSDYYGVGTRIEVYTENLRQIREIRAGDSFCSQNHSLSAHFGLGGFSAVDSIILRWPTGTVDKLRNLQEVDRHLTIVEGSGINQRPSTFYLLTPVNGDTLKSGDGSLDFTWTPASDADAQTLTYTLYLSGKDLWSGAAFDTLITGITGNAVSIGSGVLRDNHTYLWSMDVTDGQLITAAVAPARLAFNPFGSLFDRTDQELGTESVPSMGGSWGDYDNDGHQDLFVANPNGEANFLFRNRGDKTFEKLSGGEIVNEPGNSFGASWGDYNQDGYLDLFVANIGDQDNFLYENNGDGTFAKISAGSPVNDGGNSTACSWGDYNNDGFVDLFVSNAGNRVNFLYRNNGDRTFSRISQGDLVTEASNSFGCAWGDYDGDGNVDLFVANSQNNFLYHNEGNGTFRKITTGPVVTDAGNSRSGSWGDYDNDGDPDLYVANAEQNFFYENAGGGNFIKITAGPHVTDIGDSRSSHWQDYDNDGDIDLYVSNAGNNALYLNKGNRTFSKLTSGEFVNDGQTSNSASGADYDNDGDIDLFVANATNQAGNFLYSNNLEINHWITIHCIGRISNTAAIGAKVRVKSSPNASRQPVWQMREISAQSGFSSQSSLVAAFGLGKAAVVDSLRVEWPSGNVNTLANPAVNQFLVVKEDSLSTGIEPADHSFANKFALYQNYPNPFNPATTITYRLPQNVSGAAAVNSVTLAVYNLLGQPVRTLVQGRQAPGIYSVLWDGRNDSGEPLSSGVYIYRLKIENLFQKSRKMLMIK